MGRSLLFLSALMVLSCEEQQEDAGDTTPVPPEQKGASIPKGQPKAISHDVLLLELIETTGNLGTVLVSVSDIESANRAAERIYLMAAQLDRIAGRLTSMDAPSREMRVRYSEQIRRADENMKNVMAQKVARKMREMGPEAAAIVQVAVEEFFSRMKASGAEFDRHFKPEAS